MFTTFIGTSAPSASKSLEPATGAVSTGSSAIVNFHAVAAKVEAVHVAIAIAAREIEQLRLRVKELEEQLETCQSELSRNREKSRESRGSVAERQGHSESPPSPSLAAATTALKSSRSSPPHPRESDGRKRCGEGIFMSTAQSQQTQWYGPSSSYYFIGRISSYLGWALQQPHSHDHMQPNSASRLFASPTSPRKGTPDEMAVPSDVPITGDTLTGTQEDYFLSLFWQSYHCTYQIVDEVQFREYYKSLWTKSGSTRKPSALVDIVLAVSMQYGVARIPRSDANMDSRADVGSNDATIAGRWFYRRCQANLTGELESPTLATLQCHIFSVIYLCNASYTNMAHSTLAVAIRTAHILGLHLNPSDGMSRSEAELRKRIWWTLYAVESKTCMKLGRPWSAQISQVACSLPADDHEVAMLSGSNYASFGDTITFLTYNLQNTQLVLAVRTIYIAFHDQCADVLSQNDGKGLYGDPQSLETCAEYLASQMSHLQAWLQHVPAALKTKRKGGGEAFSTDRSPLEVELFAPLWLQRQRLLLELLYHNLAMNLLRPFICFSPSASSAAGTPIAHGHATACVAHAMAITQIMHQALAETDILSGWHEAFQWQWNATITLLGFCFAYPVPSANAAARKSVSCAVEVFENFGNNFAVAASAADVTRDLVAKADLLMDRFWSSSLTTLTPPVPSYAGSGNGLVLHGYNVPYGGNAVVGSHVANGQGIVTPSPSLGGEEPLPAAHENMGGAMGLAFTVDSFNSFEPLWVDDGSLTHTWAFTQN